MLPRFLAIYNVSVLGIVLNKPLRAHQAVTLGHDSPLLLQSALRAPEERICLLLDREIPVTATALIAHSAILHL